jgi:hypothetical protein
VDEQTPHLDKQTKNLLAEWEQYITWARDGHDMTSKYAWRTDSFIGWPAAALSALAGTAVFATFLEQGAPLLLRVAAIVASLLAAVLSAFQTRSKYMQYSERHRIAAADYGSLKRKIERIKACSRMDDGEIQHRLDAIERRLEQLDRESPRIPERARKHLGWSPFQSS